MTPTIAPLRALPLITALSIAFASMPAIASESASAEPTAATAAPSTEAPPPEATDPSVPQTIDPAEQAELDRVLGHGRRMSLTGGIFTLVGIGALVGGVVAGAQENYGLAIGLSVNAVVASGIGGILVVAGRRRLRQPRRFMRTENVALSVGPRISADFRGARLSLRF